MGFLPRRPRGAPHHSADRGKAGAEVFNQGPGARSLINAARCHRSAFGFDWAIPARQDLRSTIVSHEINEVE
jgi:hypothetical protein